MRFLIAMLIVGFTSQSLFASPDRWFEDRVKVKALESLLSAMQSTKTGFFKIHWITSSHAVLQDQPAVKVEITFDDADGCYVRSATAVCREDLLGDGTYCEISTLPCSLSK